MTCETGRAAVADQSKLLTYLCVIIAALVAASAFQINHEALRATTV